MTRTSRTRCLAADAAGRDAELVAENLSFGQQLSVLRQKPNTARALLGDSARVAQQKSARCLITLTSIEAFERFSKTTF
jgi:hypothetical protein